MIVFVVGWSTSTDAGRPRLLIANPIPLPWICMYAIENWIKMQLTLVILWLKYGELNRHEPDFELVVRSMHVERYDYHRPQRQLVAQEWTAHFDWSQRCHYSCQRLEFAYDCRHRQLIDASVDLFENVRWPKQSSRLAYSCWRWALVAWARAKADAVRNSFAGMWFEPVRCLSANWILNSLTLLYV